MGMPRYGSTLRHLILYSLNKESSSGNKYPIPGQLSQILCSAKPADKEFGLILLSSSEFKAFCFLIWGSDLIRELKSGLSELQISVLIIEVLDSLV